MKPNRLARLILAAELVSGCAQQSLVTSSGDDGVATVSVSGSVQTVTISRPGPFDLDVSGDSHTVRVPPGNAVRTLRVSGVNHVIVVSEGASVQSIEFSGVGTTIHLPADAHPAVIGSGVEGRVLNDVEYSASQETKP